MRKNLWIYPLLLLSLAANVWFAVQQSDYQRQLERDTKSQIYAMWFHLTAVQQLLRNQYLYPDSFVECKQRAQVEAEQYTETAIQLFGQANWGRTLSSGSPFWYLIHIYPEGLRALIDQAARSEADNLHLMQALDCGLGALQAAYESDTYYLSSRLYENMVDDLRHRLETMQLSDLFPGAGQPAASLPVLAGVTTRMHN